jgi:diguanylate cyclase (GGDEF)-like protein/PAS domain S-box-containing protein
MRVLFLEDDQDMSSLVSEELGACGLTVTPASTVAEGLRAVAGANFDVAIIDLGLPDGSGLDVLRAIRAAGATTHVIILSGAAAERDRVTAFDLSADDYVVKPFYVAELCARVMTLTRKLRSVSDPMLVFGEGLTIYLAAREVRVNGTPIEVVAKEYDLLAFLATRPGHVFSSAELLRSVWVSEVGPPRLRTVAEHIYRLRGKIEDDPSHPRIIQTIKGVGYKFVPPDRPARLAVAVAEPSVFIHDSSMILSADEAAARLLGYDRPDELIGLNIADIVSPKSSGALQSRIERLLSGAPVAAQLLEVVRSDGETVQVEVATSVTQWRGETAWRAVLTPEESAAAQLLRLATGVVTHIPDAVIVVDLAGYVRVWNLAAERAYGWDYEAAKGRHLADIVPWVAGGAEFETAWAAILERGEWHGKVRLLSHDRSVTTVLASAREVLDAGGRRVAAVFTFRPSVRLPTEGSPKPSNATVVDLRRGIENDEIVVHYQPLIDLRDGSVIGFEALARWEHPDRGLLTPESFMFAAEHSGLIGGVGAIVRRKALRQIAQWRASGHDIHVAINLSARELSDPALVESVAAATAECELEEGTVWFEVTETALVEDMAVAGATLNGLVRTGARVSIDDFGTGWGSLVYLRNFPIHTLKIDREFIAGLPGNLEDAAISRSVIGLGAELGQLVIAEGVETPAQRDALIELGCPVGQGFLFGRPVPANEVSFKPVKLGNQSGQRNDDQWASNYATRLQQPSHTSPGGNETAGKSREVVSPEAAFAEARRELLWATSCDEVRDAGVRFVQALGGEVVLADEYSRNDALPDVLAFTGGPPLVAVAPRGSVVRQLLERYLPEFIGDAERAVAVVLRTETLWADAAGDALTGIANRRYLDRAVARAHEGDALVMIDLDHFKELNDDLGHLAGDNVLRCFGTMLREEVRADDLAGRYGGDEFLILLRSPANPAEVCARLRNSWIQRRPSPATFSAGWAHVDGDQSTIIALELADCALYLAKTSGRDFAIGTPN